MKLSIKHSPIGKPAKDQFNFQNWTYGWLAVDFAPRELAAHLEVGKPFAVGQYARHHRKAANFLQSDLIAIDIDAGADRQTPLTESEYQSLLHDASFIKGNAFAIFQTASSKPDAYKCRVLFHLNETITDAAEYKKLVTLVMSQIPFADPATKDAARAFFGGQPGRPADFLMLDNCLDVAWLRGLEAPKKQKPAKPKKQTTQQNPNPADTTTDTSDDTPPKPADIEQVRYALRYIPKHMSYEEWLAILMAIHSVFPGADGVQLAEEWSPGKPGEIQAKFDSFKQNKVTLGTLYYYAMQHGYRFPRQHPTYFNPDKLDKEIKVIKLNARFLTQTDLRLQGAMLVKSPIGTGKTEWIIRQITDDDDVLIISHRRTLARELTNRFNETFHDFADYEDHLGKLTRLRRLVITPNSLHKIIDKEIGIIPHFSIVILDEIEQILDHAAGNTMHESTGVRSHAILAGVVERARWLIGADANLSRLSIDWVARRRHDVTVALNEFILKRGEMFLLSNREQTIGWLLADLEKSKASDTHKPIVIATDSKSEVKILHRLLESLGYKGFGIHADNRSYENTNLFLKDIDQNLAEQDYLIYSPTISAGIDIQTEVETVYGFFRNLSLIADDQLQMLGRARKASRFVVYSANTRHDLETSAEQIKANYVRNLAQHAENFGFPMQWNVKENRALYPPQEDYLLLQSAFWAKRNRYMSYPRQTFIQVANELFDLSFVPEPKEEEANLDLKEKLATARDAQREYEQNLILTSDPIYDKMYQNFVRENVLIDEVEYGHRRYQIEEFYHQRITPELLKEATNRSHGGPVRLQNFINLHKPLHKLVWMDEKENTRYFAHTARQLNAQKMVTLWQLLEVVFGERLHTQKFTEEAFQEKLLLFNEKYESLNVDRVFHRRTNSEDTPLKRFRWILSLVGLKLKVYRNRHKKTQSYGLHKERYEEMIRLGNSRAGMIDNIIIDPEESSLVSWRDEGIFKESKSTDVDYGDEEPPDDDKSPPDGSPQARAPDDSDDKPDDSDSPPDDDVGNTP